MAIPAPGDIVSLVIKGFTTLYENNYVLYALVLIISICIYFLFRG